MVGLSSSRLMGDHLTDYDLRPWGWHLQKDALKDRAA